MNITTGETVLIAGGTGLIGKRLCELLSNAGYQIKLLSRNNQQPSTYPVFVWDPSNKKIDLGAFNNVTHVVNLAGSGIADHRWTAKYKNEILQSRLDATATLLEGIKTNGTSVKSYIAASAIGFYGDRGEEVLNEASNAGKGFLAETVVEWEAAAMNSSVRTVWLRTGIVLTPKGGALPPMALPIKAFIAPIVGGNQYMSWIHLDDLCNMYLEAISNTTWNGIVNGVAPESIQHRAFISALKGVLNPHALTIAVPVVLIKLLLGEQSTLILNSARVQPSTALKKGFEFNFADISLALQHLYGK